MTGMKNRFVLTYVLLVIAQMLLCNYFHFTPYIMLTILPIMVFCIPTRVSVFWTLIIAFVTGLAVDYFAEGIIGLNAAALLPVSAASSRMARRFEARTTRTTIRKMTVDRAHRAVLMVVWEPLVALTT